MPPTQYNDLLGKPTISATQDQIPELQEYLASQTQGTQESQMSPASPRRVWPWVVAVLGVLLIVVLAIMGGGAMNSAR